jgi:hypothetical protein
MYDENTILYRRAVSQILQDTLKVTITWQIRDDLTPRSLETDLFTLGILGITAGSEEEPLKWNCDDDRELHKCLTIDIYIDSSMRSCSLRSPRFQQA